MELAKHLLGSGSLLLSKNLLNEFGYLLHYLLDHRAWLPLSEAFWQHMQQKVSAISQSLVPKLSFGHDQGWLEGIFVP